MLKAPYRIAMRRPVFERPLIGSGDSVTVRIEWFCTAVKVQGNQGGTASRICDSSLLYPNGYRRGGFFVLQINDESDKTESRKAGKL